MYTRNAVGGPLKPVRTKSGNVGDYYERVDVQIFESSNFQVSYRLCTLVTLLVAPSNQSGQRVVMWVTTTRE